MHEIDFHPVTDATGQGTMKSGDAITGRFLDASGTQRVFVIDAGYQATGEAIVTHIQNYYGTNRVDLTISTHPDSDHINGMATVVQELVVDELLVHQPRQHAGPRIAHFSNIEAVDTLLEVAADNNTVVSEPFTGTTRLNGHLQVLGPDKGFYAELVAEHLAEAVTGTKSASLAQTLLDRAGNLLESALPALPMIETLTDAGTTNPRNETSVVALLTIDGQRLLFTGDAGQRSLTRVVDEYEVQVGPFASHPLQVFQVPHHGSRRNIGPTLLDRILGPRGNPYTATSAIVSATKDNPKHPSAKVTNALQRRGAQVAVTAGKIVCAVNGVTLRPGWSSIVPLPPLPEGDDDDV
jgi:beta-lactamase superfamily II metal-dependent hydrolase